MALSATYYSYCTQRAQLADGLRAWDWDLVCHQDGQSRAPAQRYGGEGSRRQVVGMPRSYQPRVLAADLDTSYDYHRALTSTPAAPGVTAT